MAAGADGGAAGPPARAPRLAPLPARRQLDRLLEAGAADVGQLSSVEINWLVNAVGLEEAHELLELATPEQVRELVDLQAWEENRVDQLKLLDWVHTICCLTPDARRRQLAGLDVELLGLLIRRTCRIYLAEEDPVPDEPEGLLTKTPDGVFVLDITGGTAAEVQQLRAVVETLFQDDADGARRLLLNLMWELPSELEEYAHRWRQGRLCDLGFPDRADALSVYAYLDPATVRADEGTADVPLRADPEPPGSAELSLALADDQPTFWTRVVALVTAPEERQRIGRALLLLCNRTLAADRVPPVDRQRATAVLQQLEGRLSLALELLCAGDVRRGPEVLARVALLRLARLGHSLALDLRSPLLAPWRAAAFGRRARGLDMLPQLLAERLSALLAPRPQLVEGGGSWRPFRSLDDIDRARGWVAEALRTSALVPRCRWPDPLPDATLPALFCTEVLRRALGCAGALDGPALGRARARALDGAFDAAVLDVAHALAEERLARPPAAEETALYEGWLVDAARSLSAIEGPIDPRFVELVTTVS